MTNKHPPPPTRTTFTLLTLLLLGLLILIGCNTTAANSHRPGITLQACQFAGDVDARCGTVTVLEDRANPNGPTIDLHVVVIPAVGGDPAPDPLFLLAGGPGQAASETFAPLLNAFAQVNNTRDLVLVDQRGTGQSGPLTCGEIDTETFAGMPDEAQIQDYFAACLARQTANLAHYTTPVAMADLDEVRAALGYQQINLYGISYGTRAAQVYLRNYPDRVRTVVLDGVVSPDFVIYQHSARDGQQALSQLFARCAAEDACRAQFPNLEGEFAALLAQLEAAPVEVTLPHPRLGVPVTLTFTRSSLTRAIYNMLYLPELAATLPLLIHTAHQSGDFSALAAQPLLLAEQRSEYPGAFYAVFCVEDAPYADPQAAAEEAAETVFDSFMDSPLAICANWPAADAADDFRQPLETELPVLLLSGSADPITPPQYASQIEATLPNSRHLVLDGYGHGIIISRCIMGIVADFVEAGTPAGLDTACMEMVEPLPFFVSFTGPPP